MGFEQRVNFISILIYLHIYIFRIFLKSPLTTIENNVIPKLLNRNSSFLLSLKSVRSSIRFFSYCHIIKHLEQIWLSLLPIFFCRVLCSLGLLLELVFILLAMQPSEHLVSLMMHLVNTVSVNLSARFKPDTGLEPPLFAGLPLFKLFLIIL